MSGNFFLYNLNFFKGLRNVLRDMARALECVKDDCDFAELYEDTVKAYTNPSLLELSKLYVKNHEFLKGKICCNQTVDDFFCRQKEMSNVTQLFIDVYGDVSDLIDSMNAFYCKHNVELCDVSQYIPVLDLIAFPCEPCIERPDCLPKCIPIEMYPIAFLVWYMVRVGKITSGCIDSALIESGLVYVLEINALLDAYRQLVLVGKALKNVPRQLI